MCVTSFADQFFVAATWLGSLIFLLPCTAALVLFLRRNGLKKRSATAQFRPGTQ